MPRAGIEPARPFRAKGFSCHYPDEKDPKKKKVNLTYEELEELKRAEGFTDDGGDE